MVIPKLTELIMVLTYYDTYYLGVIISTFIFNLRFLQLSKNNISKHAK
jgi:hypothetical protein